jgi:hypothetical protein
MNYKTLIIPSISLATHPSKIWQVLVCLSLNSGNWKPPKSHHFLNFQFSIFLYDEISAIKKGCSGVVDSTIFKKKSCSTKDFGYYYECLIITGKLCHIMWSRKWHNLQLQTLIFLHIYIYEAFYFYLFL